MAPPSKATTPAATATAPASTRADPLFPDAQPLAPVQPRQRALHHPAMAAELLAGLNPPPGDAGRDVAPAQPPPDEGVVIAPVAVRPIRAPARPAPRPLHGRDGIEERKGLLAVVHVDGGQSDAA
jgi:hypothetical protein